MRCAQFHFRFCFRETVSLPLKSRSGCSRKQIAGGASNSELYKSVYQASHTYEYDLKGENQSRQVDKLPPSGSMLRLLPPCAALRITCRITVLIAAFALWDYRQTDQ